MECFESEVIMDFLGTPFTGYRYEDIKESLNEYFIEPQCFDALISTRPAIIEGSRGFGKTTLLQSIEYKNSSDYFGVYYKVNDNITSHFSGKNFDDNFWIRLFSCYFVLSLSYQLAKLAIFLNKNHNMDKNSILQISNRYFKVNSNTFEDLLTCIYNQKEKIIEFINNGSKGEQPYICNYSELIKEFPEAIISSCVDFKDKTVYYLIDEFENLNVMEQKCVLSFLKQHDEYHTFKIVTKPWGIIEYETIGGQQLQLIHDYTLVDLTKPKFDKRPNDNKKFDDFYEFSKKVCNRRIEKFLKKNSIKYNKNVHNIESYCEEISYEEELLLSLKNCKFEDDIVLLKEKLNDLRKAKYIDDLVNEPLNYCILKLFIAKNSEKENVVDKAVDFFTNGSAKYKDMKENYKMAFLYKYSDAYNKKLINGFKDMVNFSGGNIRFLLEFCNELFSKLCLDENYICSKKDIHEQTRAVRMVAKSDLSAIKYSRNVPDNDYLDSNAGTKLRTMIIALGKIYNIIHKSDKFSVIEPNHFVIKSKDLEMNESDNSVIRECIMNGYFIAYENNKTKSKNKVILDEYMYKLHPLYCACFGISWRQKNNITLTLEQFRKMLTANSKETNEVIGDFEKKYSNVLNKKHSSDEQLSLFDLVDEI
jgi:hypothetical protein